MRLLKESRYWSVPNWERDPNIHPDHDQDPDLDFGVNHDTDTSMDLEVKTDRDPDTVF